MSWLVRGFSWAAQPVEDDEEEEEEEEMDEDDYDGAQFHPGNRAQEHYHHSMGPEHLHRESIPPYREVGGTDKAVEKLINQRNRLEQRIRQMEKMFRDDMSRMKSQLDAERAKNQELTSRLVKASELARKKAEQMEEITALDGDKLGPGSSERDAAAKPQAAENVRRFRLPGFYKSQPVQEDDQADSEPDLDDDCEQADDFHEEQSDSGVNEARNVQNKPNGTFMSFGSHSAQYQQRGRPPPERNHQNDYQGYNDEPRHLADHNAPHLDSEPTTPMPSRPRMLPRFFGGSQARTQADSQGRAMPNSSSHGNRPIMPPDMHISQDMPPSGPMYGPSAGAAYY